MRHGAWAARAAAVVLGSCAPGLVAAAAPGAGDAGGSALSLSPVPAESPALVPVKPVHLALLQDPDTIYAPIEAPKPEEGVNAGAVHVSLDVNYLTDYVYRGIDRNERGGSEDAPNLQFNGELSFDLGKLPHPFIGLFVNVYNDDPTSRFQEVRPYAGFDWNLKPLLVRAGLNSYIFPERDKLNTTEVFGRLTFNDAVLFHTDRAVLAPYVFAAYDFDLYNGLYLEAGVRHDFPFPDVGVVVSVVADVAYVLDHGDFTPRVNKTSDLAIPNGNETGFQHYDVGVVGAYSLNALLNLPRRYGDWKLMGYLYYTDNIQHDLRADTQIWGGMGIHFEY